MNIEAGKSYKTRSGTLAVVEMEYKDEPIYQFSGKCFDANGNCDRLAYWTGSGRYSDHQCDFDITEQAPSVKVVGEE